MGGLTRKLFLGFGAVIGILLLMGAIVIGFLTQHSRALDTVLRENYDSVVYCEHMKDTLDQAQTMSQAILLDTSTPDATAIESIRTPFDINAQAEINNSTLPGELQKSQAIADTGTAYFQHLRSLGAEPSHERRAALYESQMSPKYQTCRALLSDVSQMNLTNLAVVNGQVRGALLAIRNMVVAFILVGISQAVICVALTARGMIRPLMQLTASVRQVEQGNLDSVVDAISRDEIGVLAQAFNAMAAKLREYRRMDHERLLRTQQTTQAAIDSLPDAVAVLDYEGRIEIANRTARVHFHLEPGTTIDAVRPDWAKPFFQDILATHQPFESKGYNAAIQLFDETGERFLLPRAIPICAADSSVIGVTLVLVDVTHLRKADEFKSNLLSTVSHELKTPLTSIRMAVRLLLDKRLGEVNDRQKDLLTAARADSERLCRIVDEILAMRRVEAGNEILNRAWIPVRRIVESAVAAVASGALRKHISLNSAAPDAALTVWADETMLVCALTNLLANAIKFAPAQTAVDVHVVADDEGIQIAVVDAGPGIPQAAQGRLFERFYRVPQTGGPSGAGLGLSITRDIMALHGGTVVFRNNELKGCTFILRSPIRPATPKPAISMANGS